MNVYKLFWDEFSSWFLEMVKPAYQKPIDATTYNQVLEIFEKLLALLHPFMPFITEELWQLIKERKAGLSIMLFPYPKAEGFNKELLNNVELAKEIVVGVRNVRQEKNIPNKNNLSLFIKGEKLDKAIESLVFKMAGLENLDYVTDKVEGASSFLIKSTEFFIPLEGFINVEEEIAKLTEELEYTKGFLKSVMVKLGNERFVNSAPPKVVEVERKKQADAEEKIRVIEERLASMKK